MNRYRLRRLLAVALFAACIAVWHWQAPSNGPMQGLAVVLFIVCAAVWRWLAPGNRMTPDEVARYLAIVERQVPIPPADKTDQLARLRDFGANDDGKPVYMLNLMRYFDRLIPDSGIPSDFRGTPGEANAHYERMALPLALKSGAMPIFTGTVTERNATPSAKDEEHWNRIGIMRYPSRRAFMELLTDPAYVTCAPYKLGALHVALVPSEREAVLPDLRLLVLTGAIVVFLAVGWARASGLM